MSVCRWRTSLWPSRMAVSCATLSTTTTLVSCQRRLSVMAPLRLWSACRGAAWSSTAQPATLTAPLTLCQQAWMVHVSCVQLSVWMHFKKKYIYYTSLTCHKDICSAFECGIWGMWNWGIHWNNWKLMKMFRATATAKDGNNKAYIEQQFHRPLLPNDTFFKERLWRDSNWLVIMAYLCFLNRARFSISGI